MAKYRKLPVEIEAYQTKSVVKIETLEGTMIGKENMIKLFLEGTMIGNVGDWIITGVNGEIYPCKPDIFEKTYEKVD